jgi:hypothetical protein
MRKRNPKSHRRRSMALIAMLAAATALTAGTQALTPASAAAATQEEGPCDDPNLDLRRWLDECVDSGGGDGSSPFPSNWLFFVGGSSGATETRGHEVIIVVSKAARETDEEAPDECFKRLRYLCGILCPPDAGQCLRVIPNHTDQGREWPWEHGTPHKPYLPKKNQKTRSLELLMKWMPICVAAKKTLDDLARLRQNGWNDENWKAFGKEKKQKSAEAQFRSHECGRLLIQT